MASSIALRLMSSGIPPRDCVTLASASDILCQTLGSFGVEGFDSLSQVLTL